MDSYYLPIFYILGFPGNSVVKNPSASAGATGDTGLIPEFGGSPGEGMATHSIFLPEESHGQKNLGGYSSRDCKELDTTEAA